MRTRFELFFNLILIPVDFLATMAAFVVAYIIRVKISGRPVAHPLSAILYLKIFLLILPVWILIFALAGLYNMSGLKGRWEEIGKVFVAVSGGTMFVILVDFLSRQPIFPSKAVPIYGYALSFIFVLLARWILKKLRHYLYHFKIGTKKALIIGSGEIAQQIKDYLFNTAVSGYQLVGVVDNSRGSKRRMAPLPHYRTFVQAIAKHGRAIDEIIQADSALEPDEILEMVNYSQNNHLVYRFVPNQFGLFATNSTVGTMGSIPMVEFKKTPLDGWGRVFKRAFDLLIDIPALVVALPIFVIIGLGIKLTDPGPVFYKHKRLSRVGKPMYVYKFRTMYLKYCTGEAYGGKTDAEIFTTDLKQPELVREFEKEQKLADDPRVTPFGRFLRRTSLDELPQLVNVLRGDLSLVGPRPIVEAELKHYGEDQATFLALKPGVTGLWQISGRSDLSYSERVKLDIYYVERWSIWLDIRILLKSAAVILRRKGAY